jgi:hypothetical protein
MDISRTNSKFPFPSRVEGFLECCGEYLSLSYYYCFFLMLRIRKICCKQKYGFFFLNSSRIYLKAISCANKNLKVDYSYTYKHTQ